MKNARRLLGLGTALALSVGASAQTLTPPPAAARAAMGPAAFKPPAVPLGDALSRFLETPAAEGILSRSLRDALAGAALAPAERDARLAPLAEAVGRIARSEEAFTGAVPEEQARIVQDALQLARSAVRNEAQSRILAARKEDAGADAWRAAAQDAEAFGARFGAYLDAEDARELAAAAEHGRSQAAALHSGAILARAERAAGELNDGSASAPAPTTDPVREQEQGVALAAAQALADALTDTADPEDAKRLMTRMQDLAWKHYDADAVHLALLKGLAAEITEEADSDHLSEVARTLQSIGSRAGSLEAQTAAIAGLAAAAKQLASNYESIEQVLLDLERIAVESKHPEVKAFAIAALQKEIEDASDDDDAALMRRAVYHIEDSVEQLGENAANRAIATARVLVGALSDSSDEEDGARLILRLRAALQAQADEGAHRLIVRGLLRVLGRDPESGVAAALLEALESMAVHGPFSNVRAIIVEGLEALSKDEKSSYQSEAEESLERIRAGKAPAIAEEPPAPESADAPAQPASQGRRFFRWFVAFAAAAALLAWLFS